ncbi:MAG: L-serine ammonia-lyase, iron-sulfur-dependent subunit beta [Cyanobacteria bacterium P01_H01_bin.74]
MNGSSLFDVAGPIMVGPSSSHTAGAVRIANLCRMLAGSQVVSVQFTLFNSFAHTYYGHGTDKGLLAGIMGFSVDDNAVRDAFEIAEQRKLCYQFVTSTRANNYPPNTVVIDLVLENQHTVTVTGHSTGGGRVYLSSFNGRAVNLKGEQPTLLLYYKDQPGMIALVTHILAHQNVNIAGLLCYRNQRGKDAHMTITMDMLPSSKAINAISTIDHIFNVYCIDQLPVI